MLINGGDPAAAARLKVSPFSPSPFSLSSGGWMTSSSKLMGYEREFKELHIMLFPEVRGGKGGDGGAMSGSSKITVQYAVHSPHSPYVCCRP